MHLGDPTNDQPLGLHVLLRDLDEGVRVDASRGGARDLADGASDTPGLADHAPHILRVHVQTPGGTALGLKVLNAHVIDVHDQSTRKVSQGVGNEVGLTGDDRCAIGDYFFADTFAC